MVNTNKNNQKILLAWQVQGFQTRSFNSTNIAIAFVVMLLAIAWAVYAEQWLTAVVFVLLPVALYSYMANDSKPVNIGVMSDGVMVSGVFYSFDLFNRYFVSQASHVMYLVPKNKISSQVAIPLGSQSVDSIVRLLPVEIVQVTEGSKVDFSDRIAGWLRR